MNPISSYMLLIIFIFIVVELLLMYATYLQATKLNRVAWVWIINSIFGGVFSFVVLSLSPKLKYNYELGYREEFDLLGWVLFMFHVFVVLVFLILFKMYSAIAQNPRILEDFAESFVG